MQSIGLNDETTLQIDKTIEVASYLWSRQWAERNGGNISVLLDKIQHLIPSDLSHFRYVDVKSGYPKEARGMTFFVTGTGERLRELVKPEQSSCIIRIDEQGKGYHLLWGGQKCLDFRPTSEFITHLKLHLDMVKRKSPNRAVVHTHPVELIALSHHPKYNKDSKMLTEILWSMLPEVRAFVPRGIDIIDYKLPGSEGLADLTVESLRKYDVSLWSKHGAISTGKDVLEAFDYIDVINKGAIIFMKCLAAGFVPEGMSNKEMDELASIL
jgi:rhamnulose-1-phosphate aldolase